MPCQRANASTRQRANVRDLRWFAIAGVAVAAVGCSSLLGAEPTPVPGAAATLTRSVRTPIPTPERTAGPSPGASPAPSRMAPAGSPGPAGRPASRSVSEEEIAQLQRTMEQTVASPSLPDVESVLLDRVSLATAQGGSIMDNGQAASWLRDHAGTGIRVARLERGSQSLMLQVLTEGWPKKDPIERGVVNFSLRRYDANGRPDEEAGHWKVDVIDAE